MDEILKNIQFEQAVLFLAPPGWGKTYQLLNAIKSSQRKCLFVFPLRALCDEVFVSACRHDINVCNIRAQKDLKHLDDIEFQLILATPECLTETSLEKLSEEYVFILDESHLIKLWGESFRPKLTNFLKLLQTYSPPTILLSATMSEENMTYIEKAFQYHYKDITVLNIGNMKLKNTPNKIFVYHKAMENLIMIDTILNLNDGCSLIFCKYRAHVKLIEQKYKARGIKVLSCIGGEASEFVAKLQAGPPPQVIIATSVLGHGVNLPCIRRVYFMYKVSQVEFYLQMLGRGGRDGSKFELHTMNWCYFSRAKLIAGYFKAFIKSIRNRVKYYLYYEHAY